MLGISLDSLSDEDLEDGHRLTTKLIGLFEAKTKLNGDKRTTVKCTELSVPDHESAKLQSWKFDEFAYGKPEKPLPTNARGLFTYTDPKTSRHTIVLRGYDKFFNTDEVEATAWSKIEEKTEGPYDLSLKQNGCIIFIGALPDGTLLVSSKHSIGTRPEGESHSERGRTWLLRHLKDVNKTEAELAELLMTYGLTAICELCDDDFEEHILAYPPEQSGLYLHGLNHNTTKFRTYKVEDVNTFAAYFGLWANKAITVPNLPALKSLLQDCARTGTYEGTEVEGFVVRTHIADDDFFFKYKFDEPYLLFRHWREVTKALIKGDEPKYKLHKAITKEYVNFVVPIIRDANVAKRFQENHGIIELRQQFLTFRGGDLSEIINNAKLADSDVEAAEPNWTQDRFVLVPIATIGCGKTTVATCLQALFGFGHVQNDNILQKRAAFQFATNIYESFSKDNTRVVIADRNNHMFHERESLARDLRQMKKALDPPIHFIALNFAQSLEVRNVTVDRVLKRGDNHQSIRAATISTDELMGIMDGFHKRFQSLDINKSPDDCFCHVIELNPIAGSRINLEVVIRFLLQKSIITMTPSALEMDRAIETALNYKPSVYKKVTSHASENWRKNKAVAAVECKPRIPSINYFGLGIIDASALLTTLREIDGVKDFLAELEKNGRQKSEFHVTLLHQSKKKANSDLWEQYTKMIPSEEVVHIRAMNVIYDDRVMAIEVVLVPCEGAGIRQYQHTNKYLHITIGTKDATVKPVEANGLIERHYSDCIHGTRVAISVNLEGILRGYTIL